jgi:hypothetical protein
MFEIYPCSYHARFNIRIFVPTLALCTDKGSKFAILNPFLIPVPYKKPRKNEATILELFYDLTCFCHRRHYLSSVPAQSTSKRGRMIDLFLVRSFSFLSFHFLIESTNKKRVVTGNFLFLVGNFYLVLLWSVMVKMILTFHFIPPPARWTVF